MTLNPGAELELIYVLWLLVTAVGRICMTILGSLFSVSNSLTRILEKPSYSSSLFRQQLAVDLLLLIFRRGILK